MDKLNGSAELAAKLRQIEEQLDRAFDPGAIDYDMQAVNWAHKELFQINERISRDIEQAVLNAALAIGDE